MVVATFGVAVPAGGIVDNRVNMVPSKSVVDYCRRMKVLTPVL
jgi:hypothetical protein